MSAPQFEHLPRVVPLFMLSLVDQYGKSGELVMISLVDQYGESGELRAGASGPLSPPSLAQG